MSALQVVGTVTATAFNPPSDRNLKENFAPVSSREVLEKVAALPISRWNLKGDSATPHVGPMAQDFYAAFSLGTDDKHIATMDADGVAQAAIQGLNQKVEKKDARIAELERRLEKLERLVNSEAKQPMNAIVRTVNRRHFFKTAGIGYFSGIPTVITFEGPVPRGPFGVGRTAYTR